MTDENQTETPSIDTALNLLCSAIKADMVAFLVTFRDELKPWEPEPDDDRDEIENLFEHFRDGISEAIGQLEQNF